jgi:hypothetical protein
MGISRHLRIPVRSAFRINTMPPLAHLFRNLHPKRSWSIPNGIGSRATPRKRSKKYGASLEFAASRKLEQTEAANRRRT